MQYNATQEVGPPVIKSIYGYGAALFFLLRVVSGIPKYPRLLEAETDSPQNDTSASWSSLADGRKYYGSAQMMRSIYQLGFRRQKKGSGKLYPTLKLFSSAFEQWTIVTHAPSLEQEGYHCVQCQQMRYIPLY